MKHTGTAAFLLASVVGAVAVFGLTLLIYATFFQDFLAGFSELTPEVLELISRDQINIIAIVIANLAHGLLLATVITWGRFYTPLRGAGAAAIVAFLTEVYFLFTQYAIFKTMDLVSAVADTVMWTLVNAVVGALVAWILGRSVRRRSAPAPTRPAVHR
ncbi:hypothetical protein [Microbacterium hibisci]|uniref:hypothetical protein n=1 Tax=Microbacterium hibisci TaxID=2036000 RepID=UPI0019420DF8|nr:hypothetical protein [Microbacterium hibisci]